MIPAANHFVLVNVCRTRWIERRYGMDRIVELLHPVVATLEDISMNRNALIATGRTRIKTVEMIHKPYLMQSHFPLLLLLSL